MNGEDKQIEMNNLEELKDSFSRMVGRLSDQISGLSQNDAETMKENLRRHKQTIDMVAARFAQYDERAARGIQRLKDIEHQLGFMKHDLAEAHGGIVRIEEGLNAFGSQKAEEPIEEPEEPFHFDTLPLQLTIAEFAEARGFPEPSQGAKSRIGYNANILAEELGLEYTKDDYRVSPMRHHRQVLIELDDIIKERCEASARRRSE